MKKLVVITALVIILSVSAGIATYAWFTSTANSNSNTFYAGNLSIDKIAEIPEPLFYTNPAYEGDENQTGVWYPGMKITGSEMTIINNGNVDTRIFGVSAAMKNFNNPKNIPVAEKEFTESIIITVKTIRNRQEYILFNGSLSELLSGTQRLSYSEGYLDLIPDDKNPNTPDPQSKLRLIFEAQMDELADNDVQGVTADVDIIINATQVNAAAVNELLGVN
ncbi:MAG: hypothetical protein K0S75_2606 [Clostridia bacterium]|jgi:predicted ribosomally synthesized peptide with SipW-like signal peptide|nr:hypothetical protein [Clostridia bacterium]